MSRVKNEEIEKKEDHQDEDDGTKEQTIIRDSPIREGFG